MLESWPRDLPTSRPCSHVVDGRAGKRALELVALTLAVTQVVDCNDDVGHGDANVGAHDHVNALLDRHGIGADEDHDDRSGDGRQLQDRGEDVDQSVMMSACRDKVLQEEGSPR